MKTLQDLKDIIEGLEAKYELKAEDIPLSQGLVNCVDEISCVAHTKNGCWIAEINFIYTND